MKLSDIKGFGPKRVEILHELNIDSCEDLMHFFPHEYLNYSEIKEISDITDGQTVCLYLKIISEPSIFYSKGKSIVSVRAEDSSGKIVLRWINQPYRFKQIVNGTEYYVNGKVTQKKGSVIYNPSLETNISGIVPVYALKKGLTQSGFRAGIAEILTKIPLQDHLTEEITERFQLMSYPDAIREIHFPNSTESLHRALYRIRFENTLLYFLAVQSLKEQTKLRNGYSFPINGMFKNFSALIPFQLTNAQIKTMHEVETDMHSKEPMNRLIQGDVGSGKTVIAEYALYIAFSDKKQGVLLAPTEILAEQHFSSLKKIFGSNVVLYTASLSQKEKLSILEKIENGNYSVIVGTHALLSDKVVFHDLGVVITDEQHRFGVEQRAKMEKKGIRPDVLVMSATPIPRTLALIIYADLSLSVIDEMPKGRKTVQTSYVPAAKRKNMYRYVNNCLKKDERAFVVCPLIDATEGFEGLSIEEIYGELTKLIPDCKIGVLHGRMKDTEKQLIMEQFRSGAIKLLISTTVIEVGVDIPQATYMIIEGSDHFGLATLHQLRGRVGRNDLQSYCYLLCGKASNNAIERIKTMIQSSDGFYLAQKDMEMRGFGDLFGLRQSGEGEIGSFLRSCDIEMVECCSNAADEIMHTPTLRNNELLEIARKKYSSDDLISRN